MRRALSKKTRFDVFKRDGFCCQYCGKHPPDVILEVDHIIPVSEGGENDESNLLTACFECNRGKAANSLSTVPRSLHDRADEIREREDQIAGYREAVQLRLDRIETDSWDVAETIFPGSQEKGIRKDFLRSIKTFLDRLPFHEVIEAAEIAIEKIPYPSDRKRFSYFCGVCWNKIKEGGSGGTHQNDKA